MDDAVLGLPAWLSAFVTLYIIVWSLVGLGLIVALVYLMVSVRRLKARAARQMREVSERLKAAAEPLSSAAEEVGGRAKRIGEVVESTVTRVARNLEAASDTVAGPVVNLAAFVSGVRKGLTQARQRQRADEEASGEPAD